MNPTECVHLARLVKAVCPAQKFEEDTPQVWHPLLANLPMVDAVEAVKRCGRRLAFIGPADIVAEVQAIRRVRLEHADATFVPRGDPDERGYRDQLAAHRRALGDGYAPPPQPALTRAVRPRELERMFRRVPQEKPS